jgi:hypothetical protein
MKMSAKHMWVCAACAVLIVVFVLVGAPFVGIALGALMCGAMMGAMVWMMVRGMGGSGPRRN